MTIEGNTRSMNVDFVYRGLRTALWVTLLFVPFIALNSPGWAAAFALASLWSVANVWAIARLVVAFTTERTRAQSALWALVKFPVLYGAGFLLLMAYPWRELGLTSGLAIGFHVIFAVFVLKAVAISYGLGSSPEGDQSASGTSSPGASTS